MPHVKLTKALIDKFPIPETGQVFYRDHDMKGFGVRVTAGGVKSFFVEREINRQNRRKTLGRVGVLTVDQARQLAREFMVEIARGNDPIQTQKLNKIKLISLQEVLNSYLESRRLKPKTVHDYRYTVEKEFKAWLDKPLINITKNDCEALHREIGSRAKGQADLAMRILRALFNFARATYENEDGAAIFPTNPVERLSHNRQWFKLPRRQRVIHKNDLQAWYAATMRLGVEKHGEFGEMVRDWLLLMLWTGLRASEAADLKWENVDFAKHTMTILETKNKKPHTLPLSDFIETMLLKRHANQRSDGYVFQRGFDPRRQLEWVKKWSGIQFSPHDLRRTFMTIAESLNISIYTIKRLANHSIQQNDVTAGYIVFDIDRLKEPLEQISLKIQSLCGLTPEKS